MLKVEGADTLIPFSRGYSFAMCDTTNPRTDVYINTDGTVHFLESSTYIGNFWVNCDFINGSMASNSVYTYAILKSGYYASYINTGSATAKSALSVQYFNAGASFATYAKPLIIYFGETDPTA